MVYSELTDKGDDMKNVILLHGTGESAESFWYPYVRENLQSKGYEVWIPDLPEKNTPTLSIQLPFVLQNGLFTEKTVLIGHSAGAPLVLSVLENLKVRIKQAVLVAGFVTQLKGGKGGPNLILQPEYLWEKIKENVGDIIFINSDNDPWGCDEKQGKIMLENIGGTLIVPHGEGHMGSHSFNQPYREFPLLIKLLG